MQSLLLSIRPFSFFFSFMKVFFQSRVTKFFTTFKFAVNGIVIHYWSFAVTTSLFFHQWNKIFETESLLHNPINAIDFKFKTKIIYLPTFKDNRSLMDTASITTRKPSGEILCCTKLNLITSSFDTSESFWQDWKCKKDLKPV